MCTEMAQSVMRKAKKVFPDVAMTRDNQTVTDVPEIIDFLDVGDACVLELAAEFVGLVAGLDVLQDLLIRGDR